LLWPLARAFQGTGRAGDAMPAFDTLLAPAVEQQHPRLWLRAAASAAVPVLGFRGSQAFVELLTRCEARAEDLGDGYGLALSRWLLRMSIVTDRELLRVARERNQPYAVALATVRLAIDTALDEPATARDAMRDADAVAASYNSRYIRDFARAARGFQELMFGELADVIAAGHQLVAGTSRPIQQFGYWLLLNGGLLCRDAAAVDAALDAARRAGARQVPGSDQLVATAGYFVGLLSGQLPERRPELPVSVDPWLVPRDAVDRGDFSAARAAAESLLAGGATSQAMSHAVSGLIGGSEDHWHEALRLADEHGLRLVAVDALEALGAAAAAAESSAEALRLLAAADRLRHETDYRWRFSGEQRTHDIAVQSARQDLGAVADAAWQEGLNLSLRQAVSYARRARGERTRPRHGWASLTPTEQHVVDLVAEGLTNPEIAQRLLMARGTVKTHLEHVYAKTGHRNRAELAASVVEHKHEQQ
jgi:DNA-binding CsgD family transcriptional regulator